jgi:preprotein translocase subunit SecG
MFLQKIFFLFIQYIFKNHFFEYYVLLEVLKIVVDCMFNPNSYKYTFAGKTYSSFLKDITKWLWKAFIILFLVLNVHLSAFNFMLSRIPVKNFFKPLRSGPSYNTA